MHRITLIPGDGIGPEVTRAACDIVLASGAQVGFEEVLAFGAVSAAPPGSRMN